MRALWTISSSVVPNLLLQEQVVLSNLSVGKSSQNDGFDGVKEEPDCLLANCWQDGEGETLGGTAGGRGRADTVSSGMRNDYDSSGVVVVPLHEQKKNLVSRSC